MINFINFDEKDSLAGDLRRRECNMYKKCETCNPNNSQSALAEANEEKRNWYQRLSLLRGSVPELLKRLAGELPSVDTPWEQVFRNVVQTCFQEAIKTNYWVSSNNRGKSP